MRIILATIGSLGDLHPFIAIGLALRDRGASPVLAVPRDHVARCESEGLEATAIAPGFAEIGASMGIDEESVLARGVADSDFMIRRVLLASLSGGVERLVEAGREADAVVGSTFTLAAPIAAEVLKLPFVAALLQPFARFDPADPPASRVPLLVPPPVGRAGLAWNRMMIGLARSVARRRYGPAIGDVRSRWSLPPFNAAPMMEPGGRTALRLGLWSPAYAPDATLRLTGFPRYDHSSSETAHDDELKAFLDDGSPPVVVSLGSVISHAAGDVYGRLAKALAGAGHRALLLTGPARVQASPGQLVRPYLPHSAVFPRAAAILHHGGIGTAGQALAAGKPQLVLPFMGDQFDQAARVQALGIGRRLSLRRRASDLPRQLDRVLRPEVRARAAALGDIVSAEDGAGTAADAILRLVRSPA